MSVPPKRAGFHTITPYLIVPGVARLIDFLTTTFAASEQLRKFRPDGSIMHAELQIGDSMLMMGEPMENYGPMPTSIFIYVEDCDATFAKAIEAGGVSVMKPTDMVEAGSRYGGVKDPSGNIWWVATHLG